MTYGGQAYYYLMDCVRGAFLRVRGQAGIDVESQRAQWTFRNPPAE